MSNIHNISQPDLHNDVPVAKKLRENEGAPLEIPLHDSFENSNSSRRNLDVEEKIDGLSQGLGNALSSLMNELLGEYEKLQAAISALQQVDGSTDRALASRSVTLAKKSRALEDIVRAFKNIEE